ncbi:MAG: hypothetical protein M1828_006328 [Chrysothrix sp. TS-e1954]|nr:MAG: hypothetical protein M1828_006328 [Chrysothrix sp. TS-e1954]
MSYFSSILASVQQGTPLPANDQPNQGSNGAKPAQNHGSSATTTRPSPSQQSVSQPKVDGNTGSSAVELSSSKHSSIPPDRNVWTGTANAGSSRGAAGTPDPAKLATPASAPPKKGSYKEILARAQAAKSTPASVGKITHKTQQFVSKREREKQEAEAKEKLKAGQRATKRGTSGTDKRVNGKGAVSKLQQPAQIKKDRPALEYQGTARPTGHARSKTTGPSRPMKSTTQKRKRGGDNFVELDDDEEDVSGSKRYRYAGSSEEPGEGSEDGSDDDDLEDMGGGGFAELEEEEERALRAARKEDAEALQEENAHKLAKAERKKKLAALAAKAGRR